MDYDIQRASMLKRVPAWLLDMIMLVIVTVGLIAGLSYVVDLDGYKAQQDAFYASYKQEYGVDISIPLGWEELTEEQEAAYAVAAEAWSKDEAALKAEELYLNMTLVVWTGGILGAYLFLELLIPLMLKNGQTLGKKVFGIALMRKDGVKVTTFMMFVRTVLGKFTIETMIPFLLLMSNGFLVGLIILLVEVIVGVATRDKTAIHDLMACTVAVDLSSQMIFDSPEAMEEYHARIRADKAEQSGE